jgi:hypothetical protein
MSEIIVRSSVVAPRPLPQVNVTIRPAVLSDVPFMDSLQKLHSKAVGWMPTAQFEGNIKAGRVLIAEEVASCELLVVSGEGGLSSLATSNYQPATIPVGYCLANDRYFKHDDVGIIYQMNVKPGRQRSFVGASLLKAQFERSAYGCKLYCCWCAQDLQANKFWEAMGFVPLAFRTGSESKSRIHIFWQKRIRQGDTTTPWWFPSKTTGGAVREDRIVLPIPPGSHWSDAKPLILPTVIAAEGTDGEAKQLPAPKRTKAKQETPVAMPAPVGGNGLRFAIPLQGEVLVDIKPGKAKKEKPPKVKRAADPRMESAARELKDRWLEQLNEMPLLPCGKYEVSRMIEDHGSERVKLRLLTAA